MFTINHRIIVKWITAIEPNWNNLGDWKAINTLIDILGKEYLKIDHAYDVTEGRPRVLGVKRGTATCAIAMHAAKGPTPCMPYRRAGPGPRTDWEAERQRALPAQHMRARSTTSLDPQHGVVVMETWHQCIRSIGICMSLWNSSICTGFGVIHVRKINEFSLMNSCRANKCTDQGIMMREKIYTTMLWIYECIMSAWALPLASYDALWFIHFDAHCIA